jgi:hypothetical protein
MPSRESGMTRHLRRLGGDTPQARRCTPEIDPKGKGGGKPIPRARLTAGRGGDPRGPGDPRAGPRWRRSSSMRNHSGEGRARRAMRARAAVHEPTSPSAAARTHHLRTALGLTPKAAATARTGCCWRVTRSTISARLKGVVRALSCRSIPRLPGEVGWRAPPISRLTTDGQQPPATAQLALLRQVPRGRVTRHCLRARRNRAASRSAPRRSSPGIAPYAVEIDGTSLTACVWTASKFQSDTGELKLQFLDASGAD